MYHGPSCLKTVSHHAERNKMLKTKLLLQHHREVVKKHHDMTTLSQPPIG